MSRCKHSDAEVVEHDQKRAHIHAYCHECKLGWSGPDYPWRSARGKVHQPPGWVMRLVAENQNSSEPDRG